MSEESEIVVTINDYIVGPAILKYFGRSERNTTGSFNAPPEFLKLVRPSLKFKKTNIDLTVPAINHDLQTRGLYATLYHELNHTKTTLSIGQEPGKEGLNTFLARNPNQRPMSFHGAVMTGIHPDPMMELSLRFQLGEDFEDFRKLNFLLYGLWEITERNARAESLYGDLQAANATRDDFDAVYKNSDVYNAINEFKTLLVALENLDELSPTWGHAAVVMNMASPDKGFEQPYGLRRKAKKRFISRTKELIEILHRKAMKVAELYFQEHEPKKEPSRLERYKQEHNK